MDSDDIFAGSPAPDLTTSTQALNEILETEEGRYLADNLKRKMEELSERYREMGPEDRAKFESEFASKFKDSMEKLKRVVQEKVTATSSNPSGESQSLSGLHIFGVIVLISVFG